MYFTKQALFAALAQAYLALAAENAFNIPTDFSATAGQTLDLSWDPTTDGTVSLILRSGASSSLTAGTYIAQSIENSGSYTWTLPADITRGSDYAIEIVDDSDPTVTNFTPYFVIDSTNTVASVTSDISLGATSTSITSTVSGTASSSATTTGSVSSSVSSVLSSVSSSLSSAASSASASASSAVSSVSSSLARSSSSAASSSSSAAASTSSESATPISTGGAAIATALPGLMGVLALGAMVL